MGSNDVSHVGRQMSTCISTQRHYCNVSCSMDLLENCSTRPIEMNTHTVCKYFMYLPCSHFLFVLRGIHNSITNLDGFPMLIAHETSPAVAAITLPCACEDRLNISDNCCLELSPSSHEENFTRCIARTRTSLLQLCKSY